VNVTKVTNPDAHLPSRGGLNLKYGL